MYFVRPLRWLQCLLILPVQILFLQFFKLSEQKFALLFGFNALGFVICANINAKLVLHFESQKILAYALMIMFIFTLILFINAFFHPNFLLFEMSIFAIIAMLGFIAPNTTTLAMARFKEHSGTASAGFVSFITGAINANTPVILAFIMCACVLAANGVYFFAKTIKNKIFY